MNKLYYGKGECSIKTNNIVGLEILYRGSLKITDKTDENYVVKANSKKILIFPIGAVEPLNVLFDYVGNFKITSVIASDPDGKRVLVVVDKDMNFPNIMNSKPEDMTEIPVEDMNSDYRYKEKVKKTTVIRSKKKRLVTWHPAPCLGGWWSVLHHAWGVPTNYMPVYATVPSPDGDVAIDMNDWVFAFSPSGKLVGGQTGWFTDPLTEGGILPRTHGLVLEPRGIETASRNQLDFDIGDEEAEGYMWFHEVPTFGIYDVSRRLLFRTETILNAADCTIAHCVDQGNDWRSWNIEYPYPDPTWLDRPLEWWPGNMHLFHAVRAVGDGKRCSHIDPLIHDPISLP